MKKCAALLWVFWICVCPALGHGVSLGWTSHDSSTYPIALDYVGLLRTPRAPSFDSVLIGQASMVTVKCTGTADSAVLSEAVQTAGEGFVIIGAGQTCAGSDITIPNLRIERGGLLKPITGHTITVSVNFEAGRYQVFTNAVPGQGAISFSGNNALREVYPEWWGAIPGVASSSIQMGAFQRAVDTGLKVSLAATGLEGKGYSLDNSTTPLMLNNATFNTASIVGAGINLSFIRFTSTAKPGIQIDYPHAGAPSVLLKDFYLRGAAGAPVKTVPGNFGIHLPGFHDGVNHKISNLVIENVQIDQFGDSGIRIQGPTGPVRIVNSVINDVGNYGIEILPDNNPRPDQSQDVTIEGGSLQGQARGGIAVSGGRAPILSLTVKDIDIELRESQTKPTLYLEQVHGAFITGVTLASTVSSLSIGDANIYLSDGVYGCTFIGVLNASYGGLSNVHSAGVTKQNTFIGGLYLNKAAGPGYLYKRGPGAVNNLFINPFVSEGSFARDHDYIAEDSLFKGKLPNGVTLPDTTPKKRP